MERVVVFVLHLLTRVSLRRESNPTCEVQIILAGHAKTPGTARTDDSHHGNIAVSRHVRVFPAEHMILYEASQMKERERLLPPI